MCYLLFSFVDSRGLSGIDHRNSVRLFPPELEGSLSDGFVESCEAATFSNFFGGKSPSSWL